MKSLRMMLLLLPPLLVGCVPVIYSEQPLGEEVAILNPQEWDGLWLNGGREESQLVRLTVTDSENGMLDHAGPFAPPHAEFPCEPAPAVRPIHIQFRRSGSWYIQGFPKDGLYETYALIFREGSALYGYGVDADRVKELVKTGALPGRIENDKVILAPMSGAHYQILLDEKRPAVILKPNVLLKLPAALNPCKKAEQAK